LDQILLSKKGKDVKKIIVIAGRNKANRVPDEAALPPGDIIYCLTLFFF
jgi:hypothetical protein